jgi:hypothetical protein
LTLCRDVVYAKSFDPTQYYATRNDGLLSPFIASGIGMKNTLRFGQRGKPGRFIAVNPFIAWGK